MAAYEVQRQRRRERRERRERRMNSVDDAAWRILSMRC